jgi:creatinine amidohydrolase/Fe(II)-dependent formamide hydrolase-like protein
MPVERRPGVRRGARGRALLARRMRSAPALIARVARQRLAPLPLLPGAARQVVATGLGSSAAQAALLAHLLGERDVAARAVPTGALLEPWRGAERDVLVVFSQGLSPNARLALQAPERWLAVIVVTAAARPRDAARRAALAVLRRAGGVVVPLPGGAERGLLLRVAGPLTASAMCFRLADALREALTGAADLDRLDAAAIARAMRDAERHAVALARRADPFNRPVVCLASGGYGARCGNLSLKLSEALLLPPPPVVDLLDFAHGPFQQLYDQPTTLLALTRRGATGETRLLTRAAKMLVRGRHRLLRLPATLPGALALFEHEAMLNRLVLEAMTARQLDPADWPGRGRDAPLYAVATPPAARAPVRRLRTASALAALTWPELAAARAAGCDTALLPLGATEQHGAHLPFATDTLIAEALAARLCQRLPNAIALPALPIGCSAEHGEFPGTLSLGWDTLRAVLVDLVAGLGRQGFARIVLFSAHGGNDALLSAAAPALRAAGRPARVIVCSGIDALAAHWQRASGHFGVPAGAAGHHAGEFESSLIAGLRPAALRRHALRRGHLHRGGDAQRLFYPSLRRSAPSGVVGDPRRAAATRAAAYLDAWVDALLEMIGRT